MDKWLRNVNVVRVIALVLGILLWVIVQIDMDRSGASSISDSQVKTISNVSIRPVYDETMYAIRSIEPETVMITLRGTASVLRKLNPDQVKIVLDLTKYGKGTHADVPLRAEGFPSGVSIDIEPSTVKVNMEEKVTKEVPITMNVTGTPASGLKAGQPVVKPSKVYVTVPSSRLDEVDSVKGEINVDGAKAAVTKQVKLAVYDKQGKEVNALITPQSVVDVEVPVTVPFKQMPLQIKITGLPPVGFSISSYTPSVSQVTVYGPQEVLDEMEFYDGAELNLSNVRKDETVKLEVPLKPRVTQVEPTKLDVEVKVVPSVTRTFANVPLKINGSSSNYTTKVRVPEPGNVDVTLEGAPDVLDKVQLQDVQAAIDVSSLTPGLHEVTVAFNLPQFVKRTGGLVKATVEITAKAGQNTGNKPQTTPEATPEATPTSEPQAPASTTPATGAEGSGNGGSAAEGTPEPNAGTEAGASTSTGNTGAGSSEKEPEQKLSSP
ncbi:CdaR family protein [Paenibacillus sp. y28]|uniref:CdaR family protein n=1 Tax=Paenibacillus sp. y28 TaxID=3129110 RepID=UPI003016957B